METKNEIAVAVAVVAAVVAAVVVAAVAVVVAAAVVVVAAVVVAVVAVVVAAVAGAVVMPGDGVLRNWYMLAWQIGAYLRNICASHDMTRLAQMMRVAMALGGDSVAVMAE